jgi:hypothetical protein
MRYWKEPNSNTFCLDDSHIGLDALWILVISSESSHWNCDPRSISIYLNWFHVVDILPSFTFSPLFFCFSILHFSFFIFCIMDEIPWSIAGHKDKTGHKPTSDNMCYNPEGWVKQSWKCIDKGRVDLYISNRVHILRFANPTLHRVLRIRMWIFRYKQKTAADKHISRSIVVMIPSVYLLIAGFIRFWTLSKRKMLAKDMIRNWLYFVKMVIQCK